MYILYSWVEGKKTRLGAAETKEGVEELKDEAIDFWFEHRDFEYSANCYERILDDPEIMPEYQIWQAIQEKDTETIEEWKERKKNDAFYVEEVETGVLNREALLR